LLLKLLKEKPVLQPLIELINKGVLQVSQAELHLLQSSGKKSSISATYFLRYLLQ